MLTSNYKGKKYKGKQGYSHVSSHEMMGTRHQTQQSSPNNVYFTRTSFSAICLLKDNGHNTIRKRKTTNKTHDLR